MPWLLCQYSVQIPRIEFLRRTPVKFSFFVLRCIFYLKSGISNAMLKALTVSIVLTQPS
jgi:hypothetical protein